MATVFEAANFHFTPPPQLAWARRVLIKPSASSAHPYPVTTSPDLLQEVVSAIRSVTDAEILIADSTPSGAPIYPIYETLRYAFNRVLLLDVKDSIFLEMENPLDEFFATSTFWIPNLVLRSDFLISIAPFHVHRGSGRFSIANLLGLLPLVQRQPGEAPELQGLRDLDLERVLADLHFALPFDLGIVEARERLDYVDSPQEGKATQYGKIIVGEPLEVDLLAAKLAGARTEHLSLIEHGMRVLPGTD